MSQDTRRAVPATPGNTSRLAATGIPGPDAEMRVAIGRGTPAGERCAATRERGRHDVGAAWASFAEVNRVRAAFRRAGVRGT